jgi:hypothetical protein
LEDFTRCGAEYLAVGVSQSEYLEIVGQQENGRMFEFEYLDLDIMGTSHEDVCRKIRKG